MEKSAEYPGVTNGEGYAVGRLEDLGDGYGFRKVRKGLGVTAFGVNAIVVPPGYESTAHYHDIQEELYFVHAGHDRDGVRRRLGEAPGEGAFARVDARRRAGCATSARSTPSTCAPAARTATSAATGARPTASRASDGPPGAP